MTDIVTVRVSPTTARTAAPFAMASIISYRRLPMAIKRFRVRLGSEEQHELFFEVPFDVKAAFGKARAPVKVSINGYEFLSTVSVYGGRYYVPVRRDRREAAGVKVGDFVDATLELDTAPRPLEVPPELADALARNKTARARWEKLARSHQREHVEAIVAGKKPETRARRVAKTIDALLARTR